MPQHHTELSWSSAHACSSAVVTTVAGMLVGRPCTWVGFETACWFAVLLPTSPYVSWPQHHPVPSVRSKHDSSWPTEICWTHPLGFFGTQPLVPALSS